MLALAAGCAPGSSATTSAPPSGSVVTDVSKIGNVTLTEYDFFSLGAEGAWWKDVIAGFEQKYPNIKIKRTTQSYDDTLKTLNLKMSGNDAPDLSPVNNGWQSMGTLVKGGRLLNLDNYSKAYGWSKRLPPSIAREHQFGVDGKSMGTGSLFGMPVARSTIIGVYYNRKKLAALGLSVPTTFSGFEAAAMAAKQSGQTPMVLGTLEQWSTTAPLFAVQNALGDKVKITDFAYSQGKVALASTGMTDAAGAMQRWAKEGLFTKDFSGVSSANAGEAFAKGTGVFRFDYSGSLPLTPQQRAGYGFFLLPRKDGGQPVATGATATNYSVSAKSKHPDAAAAFLDYVSSEATAALAVKNGLLPLLTTRQFKATDALSADETAAQAELDRTDSYVPFLDWSTPTFLDTLGAQTQQLLAQRITATQLVEAGQKDYEAWQQKRGS